MDVSLLPQARSLERRPGSIRLQSPLRVSAPPEWRGVLDTFARDLDASVGWGVEFVENGADLAVLEGGEGGEGFGLDVSDVITVRARTPEALAHALTTLRQLGPVQMWSSTRVPVTSLEFPRVSIEDEPQFSWRGVHLDVARHFFDVAEVCRLIDLIAAHRLNRLHLHLNDDQGWRVEVPLWPRLTDVGARRRSSPLGHEDEGRDDNVAHGGFYTAADVAVIREHAARRFVRIVPEVDLPGHAQAAIAAYPELGNIDEPLEVWTRWGVSEHVLNVSDVALNFAEEVVSYVAGLFPDSPVHIGGDECPTTEWAKSEEAREIMRRRGFSDPRQLQGLFTQRLARALREAGHEVVAWDDVLDAEVEDGTIIAAWRGPHKGVEAARRGLDVVMAPMEFLYFDWLNSNDPSEPVALAPPPFSTPWEKVYGFSVMPEELEEGLGHHVLGAQAQLWTEYIATRDRLDYMAFPRVSVFSEVVWGTATTLEDFRPRLEAHLGRLAAMGVRYRPLDPHGH